jgi:hypothetical protein
MEVEVVDAEDLKRIVDSTIGGPRVVPGTISSTPADPPIPPTAHGIAESGT